MNIVSLLVKEKHLTNSKTGVSVLLIKPSQLNDILPIKNNGNLTSKLFFFYLQFPILYSNTPSLPANVFFSCLSADCNRQGTCDKFLKPGKLLTNKLIKLIVRPLLFIELSKDALFS